MTGSSSVKSERLEVEEMGVNPDFTVRSRESKLLAARSGALIYAGAGLLSLIESRIPGGPHLSPFPGVAALAFALVIALVGTRLPVPALAALGPIGAALIADSLATTHGPTDGAVLYIWPVLWEAYFFGRRGAIGIVLWVGLVHGLALLSMPPGVGYLDRWLDVMAAVAVVATVVELLATRNRRLLERLAREARVDNLTGLLNRRGFAERAALELARARRELTPLGLVSFDLDHFKVVNDEWGHDVGDRVLVATARTFESQMREVDVLARMGGEEFVVLLPGSEAAAAGALAERVRESLSVAGNPDMPPITVSAGVAAARAPADLEQLLKEADRALYAAKGSGRNRTVVVDHEGLSPG
jgi:diguanylate cyclase (GGDEF)-like protein